MSNEQEEFYLAYVTQLRSEHRRLKDCLVRVEEQWRGVRQGPPTGAGSDELVRGLSELRAVLARHFAEEEAGGCMEEAVSHAPCLGRAAAEMEREDPELLKQLEGLMEKLRTAPKSIKKVEQEYRQLVQKICGHVAAESRIVKQSFGMDVD